ncbi:MAG: type III pantothenate kinase [Nitrospirae bacterium]|nr:type III pantothenate kinase [Nitrospirota bacterium]
MLLLIDIGNTNITIGFYDKGIKDVWRLNTIPNGLASQEYFYLVSGFLSARRMKKPEGAVICSVVPEITPVISNALRKGLGIEPINVNNKLITGIKFRIKHPDKLGADRIANAAAARQLYKGPLIVIDFGTATTFCVISARGEYLGGVIMPGLRMAAEALCEKTAKLPMVELSKPEKILGNDTKSSINSGVILGQAGAVERIIREIKEERSWGGKTPLKVIATGGLAQLIAPYIKGLKTVNPLLTLEGLRIIYGLNVKLK